jgi:uncharacterized membrane protein YcaP (DUF421 family)
MNWSEVVGLKMPVLEIVVRASLVYLGMLALLSFARNRDAGPLSLSNLLTLVLMAAATHHALAGKSESVADGLLLVVTIFAWSYAIDWLGYRFPAFKRMISPRPLPVIDHGKLLHGNMRRESISEEDLVSHLRRRGIERVEDVKRAYVEPDGELSIITHKGDAEPPTRKPSVG